MAVGLIAASVVLFVLVPRTGLYPGVGFWLLLAAMGGCFGAGAGLLLRRYRGRGGRPLETGGRRSPGAWLALLAFVVLVNLALYGPLGSAGRSVAAAGAALIFAVICVRWYVVLPRRRRRQTDSS